MITFTSSTSNAEIEYGGAINSLTRLGHGVGEPASTIERGNGV